LSAAAKNPRALAALLTFVSMAPTANAGYLAVIEQAPAFALVDQAGHPAALSDLKGSVVVLAFMYTHCTTVCPLVTDRMQAIAKRLAGLGELGSKVKLVSISFDPARDTPAWLATYSRSVGADPRWWLFLTGSHDQIAQVLDRYDFHAEIRPNGDFNHVSRIYLIDPSGSIRQIYSVEFLDPTRVERDVTSLLAERRQANWVRSQ
jgi:protein SCO1/2